VSLDPHLVAARLAELRSRYAAETIDEAQARLEAERPRSQGAFAELVAARLAELRALCELARYLHARR